MITTRNSCIFTQVTRDFSAVGTNTADPPHVLWVALRLLDQVRDPNRYNPTPWAYVYDGFPPDRSQPPDPCAS
jgi:hypothetical protein